MRTKTRVFIDWAIFFLYCLIIFSTMRVLPVIWGALEALLGDSVEYIPAIFITSTLLIFLFYVVFIKKVRDYKSYLWFNALTLILIITYNAIKSPFDKMHLFEYFIFSFLLFKALHHHIFNQKLYFYGALFSMVIAIIDESVQQLFIPLRGFSYADIGSDVAASILGELSIALIARPRLEKWRFKLKIQRRLLHIQDRWVKRRKIGKGQ